MGRGIIKSEATPLAEHAVGKASAQMAIRLHAVGFTIEARSAARFEGLAVLGGLGSHGGLGGWWRGGLGLRGLVFRQLGLGCLSGLKGPAHNRAQKVLWEAESNVPRWLAAEKGAAIRKEAALWVYFSTHESRP